MNGLASSSIKCYTGYRNKIEIPLRFTLLSNTVFHDLLFDLSLLPYSQYSYRNKLSTWYICCMKYSIFTLKNNGG